MKIVKMLWGMALVAGFAGCSIGGDDGAQMAIKMVQDYKPETSQSTVFQMVSKEFSNDQWAVSKTSDDLYHVIFRGSHSGQTKELLFGVSINNGHVMALNRDALAYTNPH